MNTAYQSSYTGTQIDTAIAAALTAVGEDGIVSVEGLSTVLGDYLTTSDASSTYEPKLTAGTSAQFYRGDKSWSNVLEGDISIGIRGTTSSPSTLTYSNRITITPYFHTGGPWYIKSADDSSSAYLTLHYSTLERLKIKHTGELSVGGNIQIGGTTIDSLSSAWGSACAIGADGNNKAVIGYVSSSTNGVTYGSHTSAFDAWAPVNLSGTQIYLRESERIAAKLQMDVLVYFQIAVVGLKEYVFMPQAMDGQH